MGLTHALNGVSVCIYMLCMLNVPAASKVFLITLSSS